MIAVMAVAMDRGGAIRYLRKPVDFKVTKPFCTFVCQYPDCRITEGATTLLTVSRCCFPFDAGSVMRWRGFCTDSLLVVAVNNQLCSVWN
jgi:hypothetical protein